MGEPAVEPRDLPARAAQRRAPGGLRRLLPWMRPYRRRVVFAVFISIFALGAQTANPLVVKHFVDDALTAGRHDRVVPYALAALGLGFTQALFWFLRRNALGGTALGVEYDLRNALYRHLQRLHVGFHDGWQSGQLVSRAISDIGRIRRFLGFGLAWLILYGVLFVFVIGSLLRLDFVLGLVVVVFSAPVVLVSHRFARKYRAISLMAQDQEGDLTTIVEEAATGIRVIKAFGNGYEQQKLFRGQATTLLGTALRAVDTRAVFWSGSNLILSANVVLILLLGGLRVTHGGLTLGGLVAFIAYQLMIVWPIRDVGWIIANAQEAFAAADRVYEILDTDPDIADFRGARPLDAPVGHIAFEDVGFVYPGTDTVVLRGLDLDVRTGETLAIVGMTGCGKTTVAALATRFYDPTSGRITFDGKDLRDLTLSSLRAQIGIAFEDPILFSASVRENLLMGRPEASDEDLWDALETVQGADFIRALPWQLDTRVGEQGYSLSGGQRQRLGLARAILGGPRVVVLDDPLSSVDVHTEAAIEDALRRVLRGRTAILIAHRPSTVLLADRVALLHEGRVVATGTHHELLDTVPLYREVLAKDVESEEVSV